MTLLLAIPVMIVFFVLLGGVVRSRAGRRKALRRLAAQFADRIRTLPTILANHALTHEHGKIERRMTAYADSTMGVLKVGLSQCRHHRLLLGAGDRRARGVPRPWTSRACAHSRASTGLELWQSLFILIIAADFFTPFRRYAEQYHVKAEGEAAAKELDWYFARPTPRRGGPFAPGRLDAFDVSDLPQLA